MATALEPRGVFVRMLDLIRSTMHLWNRVLNEAVEPPAVHGTVEDFIREAEAYGPELQQHESCPISTDRIDVLGLGFCKGIPVGRFRRPTPLVTSVATASTNQDAASGLAPLASRLVCRTFRARRVYSSSPATSRLEGLRENTCSIATARHISRSRGGAMAQTGSIWLNFKARTLPGHQSPAA